MFTAWLVPPTVVTVTKFRTHRLIDAETVIRQNEVNTSMAEPVSATVVAPNTTDRLELP